MARASTAAAAGRKTKRGGTVRRAAAKAQADVGVTKRRGRPKGSTGTKRGGLSATAAERLQRERVQKEKWRAAAKEAREQLKEAVRLQKAAERQVRQMEKMTVEKEKAMQAFAETWERKYLGKLESRQRSGGKRAPRRAAA